MSSIMEIKDIDSPVFVEKWSTSNIEGLLAAADKVHRFYVFLKIL